MPRAGGTYSLPPGSSFSPNTTIESAKVNAINSDLESDANTARPIVAGGTGGTTAVQGHDNLTTIGANIASATTTDLSTATGIALTVTGTTTITAFGTEQAGALRVLTFAGALTLTHNATSLILPGGANITTAAGDVAVMLSLGSGNWRCIAFQPASGRAVVSPSASTTVSGTSEFATAAEYRTGTDTARSLVVSEVWSSAAEVTLTDAATIAVDMSTFINAVVTLGGNRALGNPTNEKVGQSGVIRIVQDGAGSRTLSYGTDWEFAGGTAPTLSTAIGAQDLLFYHVIAADRIFANLIKAVA